MYVCMYVPALLQKRGDLFFGHSKEPLIHVPFDRVVVDTLQRMKNENKIGVDILLFMDDFGIHKKASEYYNNSLIANY